MYSYTHQRPAVAVDAVILRHNASAQRMELLLIQRAKAPFEGRWALPGGHVDPNESLVVAAARELAEETGVTGAALSQVGTFGDPGRDPRGWYISVAYMAIVPEGTEAVAADDARAAKWFALDALPELAFDHAQIIAQAQERLW
jgi:8-oxo-dGTP diphosphatase